MFSHPIPNYQYFRPFSLLLCRIRYAKKWDEAANQTTAYIAAGTGREIYRPTFTYMGFRFVGVSGLPADYVITAETLVCQRIYTDLPHIGSVTLPVLSGSDADTPDVLNRLQDATFDAQVSQFLSIPTDCPQREKRGWMGDAHMSASEASFNVDTKAFHANFLDLIRDNQKKVTNALCCPLGWQPVS